jgi:hypothetical protein
LAFAGMYRLDQVVKHFALGAAVHQPCRMPPDPEASRYLHGGRVRLAEQSGGPETRSDEIRRGLTSGCLSYEASTRPARARGTSNQPKPN